MSKKVDVNVLDDGTITVFAEGCDTQRIPAGDNQANDLLKAVVSASSDTAKNPNIDHDSKENAEKDMKEAAAGNTPEAKPDLNDADPADGPAETATEATTGE